MNLNVFPIKFDIFFQNAVLMIVTTDVFIFPVRKALPVEI